jgi:hypothetical protein
MVMPMDGATPCPIEFFGVMQGRLSRSLALLRGKGGNWGMEVDNSAGGILVPRALRAVFRAVGGQADSFWVTADGQADAVDGDLRHRLPGHR